MKAYVKKTTLPELPTYMQNMPTVKKEEPKPVRHRKNHTSMSKEEQQKYNRNYYQEHREEILAKKRAKQEADGRRTETEKRGKETVKITIMHKNR